METKAMEEAKTTKTEEHENGSGWKELLLETVVRSIQSFVDGTVRSVHQTAHMFTKKMARRAFLFLFSFLGIAFLLAGLSKLLGAMYRLPGVGEVIIGAFILLISLVIYAFSRDDRS